MNIAQQARIRGFNANLSIRGKDLISPNDKAFRGLFSFFPVDLPQFELGPGQQINGTISVLRETFEELAIEEQSTLTEKDTGKIWKVLIVENNPVKVDVLLHSQLLDD